MTKILNLNGQAALQSVKVKVGQLYQYHIDIENGGRTIWNILLKKQIIAFQQQNGLAIKRILEDVQRLQKEYLVFEGETIKINLHTGKPDLLEGKTEEELNKKWEELMNAETTMIV